jgi:hypothetical protein
MFQTRLRIVFSIVALLSGCKACEGGIKDDCELPTDQFVKMNKTDLLVRVTFNRLNE